MLTIAQYWIAASYVISIGLVADQMRRPLPVWEAAGRERRFWVGLSLVMGFHGLGQYGAIAYLAGVVPRFRAKAQAHQPVVLPRPARLLARRPGARTVAEQLALVAALLVFGSSFIHAVVIADHFEYDWRFGVFFAVVTFWQAVWAGLAYGTPLNPRVLVAGAVGNAALVVVWLISRTVGVPLGPQAGRPEAIGEVDVISTLDELGAVVLVAIVLRGLRGGPLRLTQAHVRTAAALAGPLFIYSLLAISGGHHHHG
jgi:hypothetical protein